MKTIFDGIVFRQDRVPANLVPSDSACFIHNVTKILFTYSIGTIRNRQNRARKVMESKATRTKLRGYKIYIDIFTSLNKTPTQHRQGFCWHLLVKILLCLSIFREYFFIALRIWQHFKPFPFYDIVAQHVDIFVALGVTLTGPHARWTSPCDLLWTLPLLKYTVVHFGSVC